MPSSALRPCAMPACPVLVREGYCPAHARLVERARPNRDVRRWYATVRWFRLRAQVLFEAAQTCAGCGHVDAALDVDHVVPHRGDPVLFWSRGNLQALCKSCHSRKTSRGE